MRLNIFLVAVATTAVVAIDSTSPNPIRVTPAAKLVRHRLIRRSDSEHVVLTDCTRHRKNYLQASQLAYFVGPPDDSPDRTTNVTSDKQQAWAGSGKITIKSSDNVAFSVEIPTVVGEGQFAGSGHNGYSAFSCYAMFKTALYTTKEGLVCDQVYDCDHTTPPVTSATQSSPTATPATTNNKSSGTDTSSAQPSSASNQPSSTPGAAPASSESLSRAEQIGIGAGVAGASVVVAILAWLFPCRKNYNKQRRPEFRFSHV